MIATKNTDDSVHHFILNFFDLLVFSQLEQHAPIYYFDLQDSLANGNILRKIEQRRNGVAEPSCLVSFEVSVISLESINACHHNQKKVLEKQLRRQWQVFTVYYLLDDNISTWIITLEHLCSLFKSKIRFLFDSFRYNIKQHRIVPIC